MTPLARRRPGPPVRPREPALRQLHHRRRPRVGVAVGDRVLNLGAAAAALLPARADLFTRGSLDGLLAAGPAVWAQVRAAVTAWFTDDHTAARRTAARPAADVRLHLPFTVADYVDFYASEHHATNVGADLPAGRRRRSPRTGSTCPSATTAGRAPSSSPAHRCRRPCGQRRTADGARLRPLRAAGHRGRARLRRRRGSARGEPVAARRLRRARLRRLPGQRLVRPRHPGVGVRAARPVPRQVLRHLGLAVGRAARRAGRARVAPPPRDPRPLPYLDDRDVPRLGPRHRPGGAAQRPRRSPGRRSPRCTGRPRRCSRT